MVKINKKGMEMSLNLIIMLIIGMVVLALVIGMVQSLVKKGESQFDSKLNEIEEGQKKEVESQEGFFAAGPSTFKVAPDSNKKVFVKIYNPTNDPLSVGLITTADATTLVKDDGDATLSIKVTKIDANTDCDIGIQSAPVTIQSKDTQVISVAVSTNRDCIVGETFFLTIEFDPNLDQSVLKTSTLSGEISE